MRKMARDSLFGDLPPPVSSQSNVRPTTSGQAGAERASSVPSILVAPSAAKRSVADTENQGGKRVRFKSTTTEASSEQVFEAMVKIAVYIGNPAKFSKASKLALQLLQAGSVTSETAEPFFGILKAAMTSPSYATEAAVRQEYQALFTAVNESLECFTGRQRTQIEVWNLWALLGNDLITDDTFVFSRASQRIRQAIDALPDATEEENVLEERELTIKDTIEEQSTSKQGSNNSQITSTGVKDENSLESDPFGLNAFLSKLSKKEERARRKAEDEAAIIKAQEDAGKLLRERREALLHCLRVAADQYKLQWAQTIIDILVKHAFDNRGRFTTLQQAAIEKLWLSVREQQVRRKQGKSTTGKLDVTPFERLQDQYSRQHISIRRAVGHAGGRSAEQWLG